MRPTEVLSNEHRVIEQVLNCLDKIVDQSACNGPLDWAAARQIVDFFRNFADRCHHGKEEQHLFPLLEAKGFSRKLGPTGVMLHEHDQGRAHVQCMATATEDGSRGDSSARDRFGAHAQAYIQLLREHIRKEDHCLFPMADQLLTVHDQQLLMRSFEQVEHEDMEVDHQKYLDLANELADRFGVPRARIDMANSPVQCCHQYIER